MNVQCSTFGRKYSVGNSKLKIAFTSKKNIDLLRKYKFINLENGLRKTIKI